LSIGSLLVVAVSCENILKLLSVKDSLFCSILLNYSFEMWIDLPNAMSRGNT